MERIHLLSCAACKRQLDVTALEIGDEVQCVCDAVLSVGPPKEVQIRGLCCGHCGGVIGEGDTTCSFCSAALSPEDRKETMLCPLCTARLPNDSRHCKSCGVELRASAVPALPRDGKCPRCDGELRVHLTEEAELVECGGPAGCGGLWCSRESFERLQRKVRKAAAEGQTDAPKPPKQGSMMGAPEASKRQYVPCLSCNQLMQRHQFRYEGRPSGVVLDVCRDHGIWFDKDELEASLTFVRSHLRAASGLDSRFSNHQPPPPVRRKPRATPVPKNKKGTVVGDLFDVFFEAMSTIWFFDLFD